MKHLKVADVITPLQAHQQAVLDKLKASHGVLVFHGLGAGKTLSSIAAAQQAEKEGLPTDVVAPAPLVANYEKEMTKHLDEPLKDIRLRSYEKAVREGRFHPKGLVILDEAHRGRNVGTETAKLFRDVQTAPERLLLTGTPVFNQPSDIAPLLNTAAGRQVLPTDPSLFKKIFVGEKELPRSFLSKIRGMKPVIVPTFKNPQRLTDAATGYVDVYRGGGEGYPDRIDESHHIPMSPEQLRIYKFHEGKMPWYLRVKVRSGLPMTKQESQELNAFQGALRQTSNTPRPYMEGMTDEEEEKNIPKLQKVIEHLQTMRSKDPNHRGLIYSNYLQGGLLPLSRMLNQQGINHHVFHGGVPTDERAQMVRDYNEGKTPVLLVSSSGTEGLDLKGTKSIQVMEPHWNDQKIEQVIGRGIRFGSHEHLPEDERKVRVMRYYSTFPTTLMQKLHVTDKPKGIEAYLKEVADIKMEMARDMAKALEAASATGPLKKPEWMLRREKEGALSWAGARRGALWGVPIGAALGFGKSVIQDEPFPETMRDIGLGALGGGLIGGGVGSLKAPPISVPFVDPWEEAVTKNIERMKAESEERTARFKESLDSARMKARAKSKARMDALDEDIKKTKGVIDVPGELVQEPEVRPSHLLPEKGGSLVDLTELLKAADFDVGSFLQHTPRLEPHPNKRNTLVFNHPSGMKLDVPYDEERMEQQLPRAKSDEESYRDLANRVYFDLQNSADAAIGDLEKQNKKKFLQAKYEGWGTGGTIGALLGGYVLGPLAGAATAYHVKKTFPNFSREHPALSGVPGIAVQLASIPATAMGLGNLWGKYKQWRFSPTKPDEAAAKITHPDMIPPKAISMKTTLKLRGDKGGPPQKA